MVREALAMLGADAARWPEIFAMNRDVLTNPDVLVAGQVLQLPAF
jgi:nucleoid-associated protein YgaU